MARTPRNECEGAINHVFAHGVERLRIFRDDRDRRDYLALLAHTARRANWRCLGYCLMSTHVHLLVETPDANLGLGMQWLHGDYAGRFNARHGRRGHVFESRYGAVRIDSDAQLHVVAAYIAMNPVTAGICQQPEDWPWSSHAALINNEVPSWLDARGLFAYFEVGGGDGRSRYGEMIRSAQLLRGLAPLGSV